MAEGNDAGTDDLTRLIVDRVPVLVLCLTESGNVTLFNAECERLSGFAASDVLGRHCDTTVFRTSGWDLIRQTFPDARAGKRAGTCDLPMLGAAGGERLVQWRVSTVRDPATTAEVFVCAGADISDRRRLEEQLLQAEKLSALGQLVAGVAHELNNPLTGVLGFAQVITSQADCTAQMKEDLGNIEKNAKRCKSIVENLLRFARQHKPERKSVDINEIIESTIELMAYHFRAGSVDVVRDLKSDLPSVSGDFNELQQVFVNLVGNALQAMKASGGRGTLTVRTTVVKDKVRAEIRDSGPGIPAERIAVVFDPFFTTKPQGEGTGLGLSVCYGIVTAHKGRIWAESPEGEGATFIVVLPIDRQGDAQVERPRTTETQMLRLKQRVLVVDDEDQVRNVLERILTSFGFRVFAASSGEEACTLLERNTVDMVVCDLRMPGMSGQGLYDWIEKRDATLAKRMVFCTGDTVARESRNFIGRTKCRVVAKPFNMSQLAQALAEIQYEIVKSSPGRDEPQ
jgi:two-component system NtrC family sensor kinase